MKTEYHRKDFMILEQILTIRYATKDISSPFNPIFWLFANSEW